MKHLPLSYRCDNTSTYQESSTPVTSQEGEEVRINFPLSADDDILVMCVTYNMVGEARRVFIQRKYLRKNNLNSEGPKKSKMRIQQMQSQGPTGLTLGSRVSR